MAQDRQRAIERARGIALRWAEPADQWRTKVQRWVDAGIVSPGQGVEILALESSESFASHREAMAPKVSPLVELLVYLGVVVVSLAAALFLNQYWVSIALAGHLSVALAVTVAGLAGGFVVSQIGDAGSRRLSGFLRLFGTAGAAAAAAMAIGPESEHHHGLSLLCVGVVVLGVSASLWRNRDRSLQFLTTLVGVTLTIAAVGIVAHLHATPTEISLLVWFFYAGVGLMGVQMLRPAPTALMVSELGCFVGAFALSFPNHLGGVLLGLVSALCAVAVGFALERAPVIVIGALGFFMFDFRIFAIYLHSANAALGAFVLGLVLVLVGLIHAFRSTTSERREAMEPMDARVETEWFEPW